MIDPELLLDAGCDPGQGRARYATDYRMERHRNTGQSELQGRLRRAVGDALVWVGLRLARGRYIE